MRGKETADRNAFRFVRAVAGYRMTGHKGNEDTGEELAITDINTGIKIIEKTFHVAVFWVTTPCSDVVGYRRFRGPSVSIFRM
jgi:hypothetical protein